MQLITILLSIVSILVILSGLVVQLGAHKSEKLRSSFFLLTAIFATIWSSSILCFLNADLSWANSIDFLVKLTFSSSILINVAFYGYIAWNKKTDRVVELFFFIIALLIGAAIFIFPNLLYQDITLAKSGNSITLNMTPLTFLFAGFQAITSFAIIFKIILNTIKTSSKTKKHSNLITLFSFAVSSTMISIFNLILPITGNWNLIWIGTLALAITVISIYYSILRYRSLNLSSIWVKIFSYIIIAASIAIVYMLIFLTVFSILFKGSTPSTEIIIFSFIMILFAILLSPATAELTSFVRSFMNNQKIDIAYIVKKLDKIPPQTLDLKQLADFLAEQMHFSYISIIIDKQVYNSHEYEIPLKNIDAIYELGTPENGIWQKINKNTTLWHQLDCYGVAALCNADNEVLGQVVIGNPTNRAFNEQDLKRTEIILVLVSLLIDSKIHPKKKKV